MSKRFTDTQKWDKAWFRSLPPRLKLLWSYLCDMCDCAGILELDPIFFEVASLHIGERVSETDLQAFNNGKTRLQKLHNGRIFIPRFITFQYGVLIPECPPHRVVIALLRKNSIDPDTLESTLSGRVGTTLQEKEEEKDKEKGNGKRKEDKDTAPPGSIREDERFRACCVLAYLNERADRNFREDCESHVKFIRDRLREKGVTVEGMKAMIDRMVALWRGGDMEKFLRPETLFNKTKFASYYDDRNQPIGGSSGAKSVKPVAGSVAKGGF